MSVNFSHEPVMRAEVLAWLVGNKEGVYVDGTVGGAGHAQAVLEKTRGRLVGMDCDAAAIAAASERLAGFGKRVVLVKANFAELSRVLEDLGILRVDGVLLDLGVSSHQLDTADRGFSFSRSAPLDMRMDRDLPLCARDIVNDYTSAELENIIRRFGEEKMAAKIARTICRTRQRQPIETTDQLADLVSSVMPRSKRQQNIHPATRTFQAIRIAVNAELDWIEPGIRSAAAVLRPGGRLGVISFHSLEDRIVKNTFRDLAARCVCPRDIPVCVCHRQAVFKILTRKALVPSWEETQRNPRARSAKLRVAERI